MPISLDQIKLTFQNRLSRKGSLILRNENNNDNVKIDMERRYVNSPTLRKRRPSTPKLILSKNRIHPVGLTKVQSREHIVRSNSQNYESKTEFRSKRSSTVSEKISEQKIKKDGKQLKIYSEYLLNEIDKNNKLEPIQNKSSPTSKELIENSNKLLEDIENDLYNFEPDISQKVIDKFEKPIVDRKKKPRMKIKEIIKKERRRSFKGKYLPADKKKILIKEITEKPSPEPLPLTYKIDINDLVNKKNIPKSSTITYTLNLSDIEKNEYEFDIESQNEHIHGNHYLDNKGIVNETISFDEGKPNIPPKPKRPKRTVPKPPIEPSLYTSEYRKEIHRISSKKKGNVLKCGLLLFS